MLTVPLTSYVALMVITLVVLLIKDRLIVTAYKGRRPNRLSNGSEDLVGYVSCHWAVTVLIFFLMELVYRSLEGGRSTHYGFIVASMEATIRVVGYLLSTPRNGEIKPDFPRYLFRINYLLTSIFAVSVILLLDWFHV